MRALALTFLGSHLTSVMHNMNSDSASNINNNNGVTTSNGSNVDERDVLHIQIPVFEYIPLHQHVPADPRGGINTLIPFLQFVANYT